MCASNVMEALGDGGVRVQRKARSAPRAKG